MRAMTAMLVLFSFNADFTNNINNMSLRYVHFAMCNVQCALCNADICNKVRCPPCFIENVDVASRLIIPGKVSLLSLFL